jgi:predicted ester cyclase
MEKGSGRGGRRPRLGPVTDDTSLVALLRYMTQLMAAEEVSGWEEIVAEDVVDHGIIPVEEQGRAGFIRRIEAVKSAFTDLEPRVDDLLVDGDRLAWQWTITATHSGGFMDMPATNRRVAITGINIVRVENVMIAEGWTYPDLLGLLQQLGSPAP